MMHLLLASAAEKSNFKWLLGSLHPGVVHFPIALLAVAALLEVLQILRKRKEPAGGTKALAYLSAATAVPAALFGFMLADHEGAEGSTVDLHKWLGVASTVVAIIAAGCAWKAGPACAGSLLGLRVSVILGAGLVLGAGYMGGELVGGEGHLLKPLKALLGMSKASAEEVKTETPPAAPPTAPGGDRVDFTKEIAPIIRDMCFKCHGGEKVKGKLKLSTKKDALEIGGESGKAIIPGKPTISKLYTSLVAAPDDEALMPPEKEKARPSKAQIERVRLWIEQGAVWPEGFEFKK